MSEVKSQPDEKRDIIRLKSIENFKPINNYVVIKPFIKNIDRKTKGGIYIVSPEFADQPEHVDRIGEVIKLPDKLFFDDSRIEKFTMREDKRQKYDYEKKAYPKKHVAQKVFRNQEASLECDTDMEMKIGDIVLFDYLESITCTMILVGEEKYFLIKYDNCFAVKRPISRQVGEYYETKSEYEIIPLNGMLICEEIKAKKLSELDVLSETKVNKQKLKVVYVGKPVRKYFGGTCDGDDEIIPGDVLIKTMNELSPKTESVLHADFFGVKKDYVLLQRRFFMAKECI